MPLPVIIIFEEHWDSAARETIRKLLPSLSGLGYKLFCQEAPSDLTSDQIVERVSNGDRNLQEFCTDARNSLKLHFNIDIQNNDAFSKKPIEEIIKLIDPLVNPEVCIEAAVKIKNTSAVHAKYLLLQDMKNDWNIKGVDEPESTYQKDFSFKTYSRSEVSEISEKRLSKTVNEAIAKKLLDLYHTGKDQEAGVVFLCGVNHANRILDNLKKLDVEVIYYFVYSLNQYVSDILNRPELKGHIWHIDSSDSYQNFAHQICSEIDYWRKVDSGNSQTCHLTRQYRVQFEAYQKRDCYVDALLPIDEQQITSQKAETIKKNLEENKIFSGYIFFNETKYLVIPRTNEREVGDNIMKIGLK